MRPAPVVAALLLSGCVYDGEYRIRGTVRGALGETVAPLQGARVEVVPLRPMNGAAVSAQTDADGFLQLIYRFGGMGPLPFVRPDGLPVATISADGYQACRVPIRSEDVPAGVSQRPCVPEDRFCFELEVLLAPVGSTRADACR
ncbi:MAG: carboxypeptidase regulatory-like domain-containing protein [Deltaproteobacteria bacterium]|nr:carboxypeptidase regulatory-like domain-containing protein [Deltaproteobacteria bacterium]